MGEYDEGMAWFKKAEAAYLAAGATNSTGYAGLLQSMGNNLGNRGGYDEEMAWFKKAEAAYLAAGATNSAGYAGLLMSMGANLGNRGGTICMVTSSSCWLDTHVGYHRGHK